MKQERSERIYSQPMPERFERSEREPIVLIYSEAAEFKPFKNAHTQRGLNILTASTQTNALEIADEYRPDVLLVDENTYWTKGLKIKQQHQDLPTIVIESENASDAERSVKAVKCLESGADDYITRMDQEVELPLKINSILKRRMAARDTGPIIKVGELEVDLKKHSAYREGVGEVIFTKQLWKLFAQLAINSPAVMTIAELKLKAYGDNELEADFIRSYINRLRNSLKTHDYIKNYIGHGYSLDPGDQDGVPGDKNGISDDSKSVKNMDLFQGTAKPHKPLVTVDAEGREGLIINLALVESGFILRNTENLFDNPPEVIVTTKPENIKDLKLEFGAPVIAVVENDEVLKSFKLDADSVFELPFNMRDLALIAKRLTMSEVVKTEDIVLANGSRVDIRTGIGTSVNGLVNTSSTEAKFTRILLNCLDKGISKQDLQNKLSDLVSYKAGYLEVITSRINKKLGAGSIIYENRRFRLNIKDNATDE